MIFCWSVGRHRLSFFDESLAVDKAIVWCQRPVSVTVWWPSADKVQLRKSSDHSSTRMWMKPCICGWSRNLNKMPESIFPASKLKQPSWRRSLENSLNRQIAGWTDSKVGTISNSRRNKGKSSTTTARQNHCLGKDNSKKFCNIMNMRSIVSKTRWELRWDSFLFKSWMVNPPWTPLIISFAYNLGFCCFPTTEIINGDYCINKKNRNLRSQRDYFQKYYQ